MTSITCQGKITKFSETILSVDSGLDHESVCVVTLAFTNLERDDYLRLARACLGKEPLRVTFTLAQTELPFGAAMALPVAPHQLGQTVSSAYQAHTPMPFPGVA
jgi:hypothetical protein